jgi:hypothetical protein
MSTSLVHVLTLIGKGAHETEKECEELLRRRVEVEAGAYGSDDWPDTAHRDIERLCLLLVKAAYSLPVVYYAQYVDGWTVADSIFSLLEWPDGCRRHICGDMFGVAFYPSQFRENLLTQITKSRKRRHYREYDENRWYLNHVQEALAAFSWVDGPSLVVSISQTLGPSRSDDDIFGSLEHPIAFTGDGLS